MRYNRRPIGTPIDRKVLPDSEVEGTKANTPEGDFDDVSIGYTLPEEGEGDNIKGNKISGHTSLDHNETT